MDEENVEISRICIFSMLISMLFVLFICHKPILVSDWKSTAIIRRIAVCTHVVIGKGTRTRIFPGKAASAGQVFNLDPGRSVFASTAHVGYRLPRVQGLI